MVKCKLKKDGQATYTIKGDVKTVAAETLAIIKSAYKTAPILERTAFKLMILHSLREDGPVWNDLPEKSESTEPSNHPEKSES